jgi:hypothetical protein
MGGRVAVVDRRRLVALLLHSEPTQPDDGAKRMSRRIDEMARGGGMLTAPFFVAVHCCPVPRAPLLPSVCLLQQQFVVSQGESFGKEVVLCLPQLCLPARGDQSLRVRERDQAIDHGQFEHFA